MVKVEGDRGSVGALWTSRDGLHWQRARDRLADPAAMIDMATGGSTIVVVGEETDRLGSTVVVWTGNLKR